MALSRLTIDLAVGLAGFESDLGRAARITERQTRQLENQVSRMAKRVGTVLGTGIGAGFAAATKAATDFERSMSEVATLLDDTSSIDHFSDSVKSLSKEFGKAPTEQANALYQIISSGANKAASEIDILTEANKLSLAGMSDITTAANAVTGALNVYGNEAGDVASISEKLFATVKVGKTTIGELGPALGPVIASAKELGISFDELLAVGATLTQSNLSTSQSFNALKAGLANVTKPSKEAAAAAERLKIQFNATALQSMGLSQFLEMVGDAANGNVNDIAALFGSVEAFNALLQLTGSGADAFASALETIGSSAGKLDKAVAGVQETASQTFARLRESVQVELIEVGNVILETLVPAMEELTDNMDVVVSSAKTLAAVIGGILAVKAVAATAGVALLAKQVGLLRAALALTGGPITVLGVALTGVIAYFQAVSREMKATELVAGDLADKIAGVNREWLDLASTTDIMAKQAQVRQRWIDADIRLFDVENQLAQLYKDTPDDLERYNEEIKRLEAEKSRLTEVMDNAVQALGEMAGQLRLAAGEAANDKAYKELQEIIEELENNFGDAADTGLDFDKTMKALARSAKQSAKTLDEVVKEFDEFLALEDQVQSLIDTLDPVGAQFRKFAEMAEFATNNAGLFEAQGLKLEEVLALIDQQARETIISMLGLGNQFKDTSESVATDAERMREAVLEGVRQMTESFGNMWTDILRGAENSFDSIRDSFAQLIGNLIRSATTDKIQLQFEQAFGEGGGGLKALDLKDLGKTFGAIAAAEFSDDVIQGLFGDATTENYVNIGKQIGTSAGAIIGTILGAPALGAGLGSLFGSIGGLLFGKLFGRDPLLTIGGDGFQQRAGQAQITTPLGDVTSFKARGNVGGFSDTDLPGFEIGKAIEEFDTAIYEALKAFGGEDQLQVIRDALMNWGGTWEDGAITIENILGSRFDTILETFSTDIQAFVDRASDFEEQVNRFGIALSAEKFFNEAPELFGGKSLSEFFAIVEDINGELGNLGQTFQEVAEQLLRIGGLVKFLEDFSASDVEAEFNAILDAQNRTVGEALANVNQQLLTAADNFDGSVEGLEEIAGLVATVREGEIRYLSQLNSLQEGLNANLDKLEAEVKGVTAAPVSVDELLSQLNAIAVQAQSAGSAEELAFLEQQFLSVARSISPEDTIANQATILALIGSFREAANTRIEEFRSAAIENAENVRAKIDELMTRIGSPLDILVASNERIAQGVEALAGTESTTQLTAEPVDTSVPEPQIETLLTRSFDANGQYTAEMNNTMRDGLDQIAIAIRDGQNENAEAIVAAIRNGRFQVIVLPQNDGFVQQ